MPGTDRGRLGPSGVAYRGAMIGALWCPVGGSRVTRGLASRRRPPAQCDLPGVWCVGAAKAGQRRPLNA